MSIRRDECASRLGIPTSGTGGAERLNLWWRIRGRSDSGEDITLTQKDIRALQLAKGAIHTGIVMLCRVRGVTGPKISCWRGLLEATSMSATCRHWAFCHPPDQERIRVVGNAAGVGASWPPWTRFSGERPEILRKNPGRGAGIRSRFSGYFPGLALFSQDRQRRRYDFRSAGQTA